MSNSWPCDAIRSSQEFISADARLALVLDRFGRHYPDIGVPRTVDGRTYDELICMYNIIYFVGILWRCLKRWGALNDHQVAFQNEHQLS